MPVSGDEELGALARKSSYSSSVIPFKKRWYSMVHPPASIPAERSFSSENESKIKDSGLNSCDGKGKSDTPKNSLLEVKEERTSVVKINSQPTMLPFLSVSPEMNLNTSSEPSRNVANSGHVLSLGPQEPHVSSLGGRNFEMGSLMHGHKNSLSLSLDSERRKYISENESCNNVLNDNNADDAAARTNRANWDLNTPMDSWVGSGNDVPIQDASQIDLLGKTSSSLDVKTPVSSAAVVGSSEEKGKQDVGASEQEFSFPISSIHPILRHKSADVLRLSLGSTYRGFDSSVPESLAKVDSSTASPDSSLQKNRNMNSPTCKTVKSEPVEEASVEANAGMLEAKVVKTEVVRQNLQSIELLTKGPEELLEQKPMKCESLQEVSQEISMTSDVIVHQSVGSVLKLQERSSSCSSALPIPLTPQPGCPSRLSTCSDMSVSGGDLSTPSEYSIHTNEANRSENPLDQGKADIAAKNANFDLKESNVKVEGSVSEGVNIEDQMIDQKTEDTHNLVASGEGLANDEEKIGISADTEEGCYSSDYESDGNHDLAEHVDSESVGCDREDEEFEDGEVREPMMLLTTEDPIAKGTDSEKKNVSYDDFVKSCDEKAKKIIRKVGNLQSTLSNKVKRTRYDKQRPISAIHQGPVDLSGIADAGSGGADRNIGKANNKNIGSSDMSPTAVSSMQNVETSVNANSSKDLSNFGSKKRVTSSPRASNATFSSNFRHVSGRSPASRSGRGRYFEMEEEKFRLRRNRDEIYADGLRFARDRIQDRPFGSSRGYFMSGRGRGWSRFSSLRRDWDSRRDFERYEGLAEYHFRRNHIAAVVESENERNDYVSRLDGADFASHRRRNPLNEDLPPFHHPPARRLSPNGREDAAMMGIHMFHRAHRNISPSRCTDDPVYSHQQAMYYGHDSLTMMQRRGFPRIRSRSPVRSRALSVGPWSSPRRRFTEGFSTHQDSSHHRSPVMYREDRIRSSPRTSFTEEAIGPQRRHSPSYTAHRLDAVQEHGDPRSLSTRRSPPDRVFARSNRPRVEIFANRERADGDVYFDGPIHTGRFPELPSGESRGGGGPMRMRNADDQEGNFRQSEQLWHEEGFDVSRLERRRY